MQEKNRRIDYIDCNFWIKQKLLADGLEPARLEFLIWNLKNARYSSAAAAAAGAHTNYFTMVHDRALLWPF